MPCFSDIHIFHYYRKKLYINNIQQNNCIYPILLDFAESKWVVLQQKSFSLFKIERKCFEEINNIQIAHQIAFEKSVI